MTRTTDGDLSVEVARRLDKIFAGPDSRRVSSGRVADGTEGRFPDYLQMVKASILSIDWEISDEAITILLRQLALLKKSSREDKIVQILVQMLISLGRYIKVRKGRANVRSMKVLKSVYAGLEQVVGNKVREPADRMALLHDKIREFHALQAEVSAHTGRRPSRRPKEGAEAISLSADDLQRIAQILETRLRELIRQEFRVLRRELLREGR